MNIRSDISHRSLTTKSAPLANFATGSILSVEQLAALLRSISPEPLKPEDFANLSYDLVTQAASIAAKTLDLPVVPKRSEKGRPRGENRFFLRWRKNADGVRRGDPMIYEIIDDGSERSTTFRFSQFNNFRATLELRDRFKEAQAVGAVMPSQVPVQLLLDLGLERETLKGREHRARALAAHKHLSGYFGNCRLADLSQEAQLGYINARKREPGLHKDRHGNRMGVAESTISKELRFLKRQIDEFQLSSGAAWGPRILKLGKARPRVAWFKRGEVARLLLAARGWQWCETKNGWKTQLVWDERGRQLVFDPKTGRSRFEELGYAAWVERPVIATHPHSLQRLRQDGVTRAIVMAYYTGSRSEILRHMRWVRDGKNGYVDFNAGIFHRCDIASHKGLKENGPCELVPRLMQHMRRWKTRDRARGIVWVVHTRDGTQPREKLGAILRPIVVRAGMSNYLGAPGEIRFVRDDGSRVPVTMHVFRHTCATILLESGVSAATTAEFLSLTVKTLLTVYGKWIQRGGTRRAAEALQLSRLNHDLFG